MIELYTFTTPNGYKVSIALEEMGLDYTPHTIHIGKNDQHTEAYKAINPASKIPAIVDHNGPGGGRHTVFESAAILLYLAEKTGQLWPSDPELRSQAIQWLFYQASSMGPYLGQAHHFILFATEDVPYGKERYTRIAKEIYSVLDKRLASRSYFLGEDYTVVDIAFFPWVLSGFDRSGQGIQTADYPAVRAWLERVRVRPAVQRGLKVPVLSS